MPYNKVHCAISKQRTGKSYYKLHKWIDNNKEERGVNHRSKNHFYTKEIRQDVFDRFGGDEAVSEWLFHIALDNLDTSVTNDWKNNVADSNVHIFGFNVNGYIYYEEKELSDEDLEDTFEDELSDEELNELLE